MNLRQLALGEPQDRLGRMADGDEEGALELKAPERDHRNELAARRDGARRTDLA